MGKTILTFSLIILCRILHAQNEFTEQTSIDLFDVQIGFVAWGDYDNDNDLDILLTGCDINYTPVSKIYRNNGNDEFIEQTSIFLIGVRDGSSDWGDYDNDGDLDILMTGWHYDTAYVYSEDELPNPGSEVISKIYRNDGNNTFTELTSSLIGVSQSSVSWGDYDNDGDLDILISGDWKTKIYRNNGDYTFTEQTSISLIGVLHSSVSWGDYDKDGDLDILLTGDAGDNFNPHGISKIYQNNGDNTFSEQTSISLIGIEYGSASWGDYDNDGALDILLVGHNYFSNLEKPSKIYRNNGNNEFLEQTSIFLLSVHSASSSWADYNNDGNLDVFLTGYHQSNETISKIYRNKGDNSFEETSISLVGVIGSEAWGDYDNDGDLDILITGSWYVSNIFEGITSRLYRNDGLISNTLPTVPSNLSTTCIGNNVTFSWDKTTDVETPQNGLTYNLAIGTSPGAIDIFSPMSDRNTGYRRIVSMGNAGHNNSWAIKGLKPGTYYWSVQAIDNNFAGSEFAEEQTFEVTSSCPNGMISYWKLDETGGSTYKDEQGINDASSLNIPSPVTGQVNGAQQFNGTSNKISAPSIPLYDFAVNSSFTFEAWILYQLPGSFLEERVAVGRKDEKSGLSIKLALLDYSLQHAVFSVRSKSGEYYEVIGKKNLNDGKWHHMVGVKDGSLNKLYLYVDGIIQNTISTKYTSGFDSPTATLDIGFRNIKYMNDYFAGCIDEVAVYNIALDAASITQHYVNGLLNKGYCEAEEELPACPQSLISLWKLDESSGSIYHDYAGNNNAASTDIPAPAVGQVLGAQQFNGTSDKIIAPRIAAYDFSASSSFTFETWLNHPAGSYTGEEVILERKPSSGSLTVNLKFNSSKVTFSARNITGQLYSVTGTKNLWDGKWHHVAGVKDGSLNQLRIYVDGVLENTVSAVYNSGFSSNTAGVSIGWRNKAGDESYFKGSIDEAAIYNTALDQTSITLHYSNGLLHKGYCRTVMGKLAIAPEDAIEAEELPVPTEYKLLQNYPNPFNPSTKINFSIPQPGFVKLIVYDMLGKEIAALVNEEKAAGNYEVNFDGLNLANGIYIYRIQAGNFVQACKMILLK